MKSAVALFVVLALISGCSRNLSSDNYTSGATSGKVLQGTIISARAVTIKEHDKLQDNTMGGLAGGAAGAVGGSAIGHGNGSLAGAVGGAIVGAVGGALVEDALGTSEGVEYLVKIDSANSQSDDTKHYKAIKAITKGGVNDDINASIDTPMQTNILSVVQKGDPSIGVGSRVYIIYSGDRPRLTAMNPPPPAPAAH